MRTSTGLLFVLCIALLGCSTSPTSERTRMPYEIGNLRVIRTTPHEEWESWVGPLEREMDGIQRLLDSSGSLLQESTGWRTLESRQR